MNNLNQITKEELERGLKIAARVVSLYGEPYLPVFNRLLKEVEKLKDRQEKESIAIKLAKTYAALEEIE